MKRLAATQTWWHECPTTINALKAQRVRPAVEIIGIDVHKRESQICIVDSDSGVVVLEQRIATRADRIGEVLGRLSPARVLIEASTESEWVARCIEKLGHEVIVADTNFAAMYATRSKKVKTDKRDARTLAEACRLGAYRRAHRTSDEQRHVRGQLGVREALIEARTRFILLARALLRQRGLRVESGETETFVARVNKIVLPKDVEEEVAPLLGALVDLAPRIAECDAQIEKITERDGDVSLLRTMPGVGAVTAAAFVAAIDGPERFRGAHQVEAYIGLVPRELSSGEKQRKGRITKAGDPRMRSLLVQCAHCVLRTKSPPAAHLRAWAMRIAARRGRKVALVALARRMAGILFAMLRDQTTYRAPEVSTPAAA
jgi:transposase